MKIREGHLKTLNRVTKRVDFGVQEQVLNLYYRRSRKKFENYQGHP